uniref:MBD domain-containing protein n=1 Tax=Cacopsylla melanoneura TaxID=428564 RepID=A0A8D8RG34_9HEMI
MKRVKVYWKRITPKQTAVLNKTKLATRSVIALSPQEKLSFDKLNRMMIKKPDLILGDESSFDNSIVEEMNQQPAAKSSPISREKENSGTISVRKDLIECTPEIISETPEIISETRLEELVEETINSFEEVVNEHDEKQDQERVSKESKLLKKFSQMDSEKLGVPLLEYGWRREIVYRKTASDSPNAGNSFADVYYHSPLPNSKKFRSKTQIADELLKQENRVRFPSLTDDHFTFSRVSLGLGEPYEVERNARR